MEIVNKPNFAMYWCKDHIFSTPIFSRIIRRDKFECILKMLHFTEPLPKDPVDSLARLRSFLEKLGSSFCNNYTAKQNISADQYLSVWKGRLKFWVYPRFTWFVKVALSIYGSNPSKIVLSLGKGLFEQGYCIIIVDNLHTSPELPLALYKNHADCCGTQERSP